MDKILKFIVLVFSFQLHAAVDIQKLRHLIDTGLSQQAFEYATSERGRYEGDPTFDYFYGIAAIDSGNASEGVFSLERVIAIQPDNVAARLELGRGYFLLEEYARSKVEFETALGYKPPKSVLFKINNYLAAIKLREGRYNTTINSYLELGLGTDSNINSGPGSANAFSQFLGFDPIFGTSSVSSSSLQLEDSFTDFTANYNIRSPLSVG